MKRYLAIVGVLAVGVAGCRTGTEAVVVGDKSQAGAGSVRGKLKVDANVPKPTDPNARLIMACIDGKADDAKEALAAGANPNLEDAHEKTTPLEIAYRSPGVIQALLKAGASPKKADKLGQLPLTLAAGNGGNFESVKLLVDAGAPIDSQDLSGVSALGLAAGAGRLDVVQYLVSKGANVNTTDKRHRTPLLNSLKNGRRKPDDRIAMVVFLVAHGANVDVKGDEGLTAAEFVRAYYRQPKDKGRELIAALYPSQQKK